MPKVGIEPTIPGEHEFESCASASSATSAIIMKVYPRIGAWSRLRINT